MPAYQLSLLEILGLVTIAALTLSLSWQLHLGQLGGITWLFAVRLALMLAVFGISTRVFYGIRRSAEHLAGNTLFAIRRRARSYSFIFLYSSEILVIIYVIRQSVDYKNSMTMNAALLGGFVAFVVHRHLARFDRVEFCENGLLVGDTFYKMSSVVLMKLEGQDEKLRLHAVVSQASFAKQGFASSVTIDLPVPVGVRDELRRYLDPWVVPCPAAPVDI